MIEVIDLSKSYAKNHQILSNVCIKLDDNRIHFLMGKNGSGKTTFIKCLLGLEGYEGCITFEANRCIGYKTASLLSLMMCRFMII